MVRESENPRVWLNLERTYNVGQYESLKVVFGASDDIREGESAESAGARLHKEVDEMFQRECKYQLRKAKQ